MQTGHFLSITQRTQVWRVKQLGTVRAVRTNSWSTYTCGGRARGVMVIVVGIETVTRVQILDETDRISRKAGILLFFLQLSVILRVDLFFQPWLRSQFSERKTLKQKLHIKIDHADEEIWHPHTFAGSWRKEVGLADHRLTLGARKNQQWKEKLFLFNPFY